ncbi:hypothetical protein C8J56DRAFT_1007103 [Mycena floridula]|nr:hypothetical protein C8J56DRAFT_1007103 [Mycena floridula]
MLLVVHDVMSANSGFNVIFVGDFAQLPLVHGHVLYKREMTAYSQKQHNEATELGITNGQEGCVVGWTLTADSENREYLETLFVKLTQPAKNISLDGLLLNVVPITRMTSIILVTFPNGNVRSVSHSQVQIILKFSMTDYNSQGRTCDWNVVNLSSSKNHQAIASSNGTVIMQALTSSVIKKVTQGIEGDLRQELHELELLDHITNMKYNRLLPSEIEGSTQNELLYNFHQYKGRNFVPDAVHSRIRWSYKITQDDTIETKPLKLDKLVDYVPAVGSKHIRPVSFVWDHIHHSCPYDALFMIFADLWSQNPP